MRNDCAYRFAARSDSAERRGAEKRFGLLLGLAAVVALNASLATASVPPPLGPAATVQRSTTPNFSMEVLRRFVEGFAQQVVNDTNASLAADGKSTRVSRGAVTAGTPYRTFTQHVDRPNQFIARAPFDIRIDVEIPWSFDRVIYIPVDIDVSCEGWWTSAGNLHFVSVPGPASIEGGNILEEVVGVRDIITSRVRSSFTPPSSSELPFGGNCATIGVSSDPNFEAIIWSPPLAVKLTTVLKQRIEVAPLSLRRLPAQTIDGQPVGNPVETVSLQSYANFHAVETPPFAMRENDQIALNLPSMLLDGEPTTILAVIGNVRDSLLRTTSTSFDVSTQSINYSPGMHTMTLYTETWQPPKPPLKKPLKVLVPTYELTYHVSYTPPVLHSFSRTGRVVSGTFGQMTP